MPSIDVWPSSASRAPRSPVPQPRSMTGTERSATWAVNAAAQRHGVAPAAHQFFVVRRSPLGVEALGLVFFDVVRPLVERCGLVGVSTHPAIIAARRTVCRMSEDPPSETREPGVGGRHTISVGFLHLGAPVRRRIGARNLTVPCFIWMLRRASPTTSSLMCPSQSMRKQ